MRCGERERRDLTYQRRSHTALRCSAAPGPENGEIEYGGLPVNPVVLHQMNQLPYSPMYAAYLQPVVENWF
jgi:hypothetical protein